MRCPFPYLIAVAIFRIASQFNYARKRGIRWMLQEPKWWMNFFAGLPECFSERSPLEWKHYRHWMNLLRNPESAQAECEKSHEARVS